MWAIKSIITNNHVKSLISTSEQLIEMKKAAGLSWKGEMGKNIDREWGLCLFQAFSLTLTWNPPRSELINACNLIKA